MAIISTLLSKLTLAYIAEVVTISAVKQSTTAAIKSAPKIFSYLKGIISDIEIPVDNHLEKAIKKSQWLALRLIVERMYNKGELKDSYPNIHQTVNRIVDLIEKDKYILGNKTSNSNEIELLIIDNSDEKTIINLKSKISELFLEELDISTGNVKELADYILLKKYIEKGWEEENLNWFNLVVAFFKNSLLGDNNPAKDAFQNQTLSQIKLQLDDFYNYADQCIKNISKELFSQFQIGLNEYKKDLTEIKHEIYYLNSKSLNLNVFDKYNELTIKKEETKIRIHAIQIKINETYELLKQTSNLQIKERFQKDIEELGMKLSSNNNELEETEKDLTIFISDIYRVSKAIVLLSNDRLEIAKTALENGHLEILENIIMEEDIDKQYSRIIEQENNLKENKEIIANEYLTNGFIILALKKGENWLNEAIRNFEKASNISSNPNLQFDIANFYKDYHLPFEAITIYKKSIQLNPEALIKSQIWNNLGIIYRSMDDLKNCEDSYRNSIEIKRLLAEENPKENLIYLVYSLTNFGVFYAQYDMLTESKSNYFEALELLERLDKEFKLDVLKEYAGVMNNLAQISERESLFELSKIGFEEAIRLKRICLDRDNSSSFKVSLADSIMNLGNVHLKSFRFDLAQSFYNEGFEIIKQVSLVEPYKFDSNLANSLNTIANFHLMTNNFKRAFSLLNKALQIFQRNNINSKFDIQIAQIYTNMASTLKHLDKAHYKEYILKSNEIISKMNNSSIFVKELKSANETILID
ncbi:MAG: tetratricopeptide repeat protein [Leadbetterella sp.]|nr:tetratricopeptide repeat protein [Leadbetterella sp.]